MKNIGAWHGFEKDETASMFFSLKPSLVQVIECLTIYNINAIFKAWAKKINLMNIF